jgi:hypothetical protein
VTRTLVLIPLLYVPGAPVPNNLRQTEEGISIPNPLIYVTGALDQNSVLYTPGTLISKFQLKFTFNNFDLV